MNVVPSGATLRLHDVPIHVRYKLLASWISVMCFYIYGDYFELYRPGKLQAMLAGNTPLGSVSQGLLWEMSAIMVVPGFMTFLSVVLPARLSRWANIVFGSLYTVIMLLTMRGGWHFYVFYACIEIVLTGLIVWYAWTWPKQPMA